MPFDGCLLEHDARLCPSLLSQQQRPPPSEGHDDAHDGGAILLQMEPGGFRAQERTGCGTLKCGKQEG